MRRSALIILGLLTVSMPAFALSNAPEMPEWMAGTWGHEDDNKWADEHWTPLRGDLMLGSGRSGTGEKLNFWEQMRIHKEDDGEVVFWAIAADQKPVRFVATGSGESSIVFENPDHDYPQRIHYWREGNALKAEISLMDGSKAVQFSFNLMLH